MTRTRNRIGLVVALVALLASVSVGPALARTFHDPLHDAAYSKTTGTLKTRMDISRVVVTNAKRVKFTMRFHHLTKYNFVDRGRLNLAIDTKKKHDGPEYRIAGKFGNIRYQKHGHSGWHNAGCRGGKVTLSFTHSRITFNLRRACINDPHRIRVRLVSGWINWKGYQTWDVFPNHRHWTHWVHR